jgi:hypothetical protein
MNSYRILQRTTAVDIICLLIKFGYDNEDNILRKPLHTLISRLNWFIEDDKRDKANRQTCPLMGNNKNKKNKNK